MRKDLPVKSAPGFTLLELLVVILVVSLLSGVLLERLWFYQEQAEKAAYRLCKGYQWWRR